jgi:hypothetical protein
VPSGWAGPSRAAARTLLPPGTEHELEGLTENLIVGRGILEAAGILPTTPCVRAITHTPERWITRERTKSKP